jgi:hypothetical protein
MHSFDSDTIIYGAILLATKLGENEYADAPAWGERWIYKDDVLEVELRPGGYGKKDKKHLEITKLENRNPVFCAALREDGEWERYRYHGEFVHIRDHFFQLVVEHFISQMTAEGAKEYLGVRATDEPAEEEEEEEGAGGSK